MGEKYSHATTNGNGKAHLAVK